MGRAARDVEGRTLASAGLLTEATPAFVEPAHAVAHGGRAGRTADAAARGACSALPTACSACRPGSTAWSTILVFVAFMALARVRNPEALRYQAPGEWGAILGLDRCPEPKTLRRKLKLLASAEHTVREWQIGTGPLLGQRARRGLGDLGRGRPREGLRRAQRAAAETLRGAPEAVPAGLGELLDQRARRRAPCCVCTRRWTRSWSRRSNTTWCPSCCNWACCRKRPPDLTQPDAGAPALTLVFDREGLEPGSVQASGPARHRLHHLAQELQGRRLAAGAVPRRRGPDSWARRRQHHHRRARRAADRAAQRTHGAPDSPAVWPTVAKCPSSPPTRRCPCRRSPAPCSRAGRRRTSSSTCASSSTSTPCPRMTWSRWTPTHGWSTPCAALSTRPIKRVRSPLGGGPRPPRRRPAGTTPGQPPALRMTPRRSLANLDELKQQRDDLPTHVRAGDLSEQDKLDAPAGCRAAVHGRGTHDRLSRRDPHDGARDRRAR